MEQRATCNTCNGSGKERNFEWVCGDTSSWKKYGSGKQTCTDCGGKGYHTRNVFHPSDFDPDKFTQAEFSKEQSDKLSEAMRKIRGS